jgi:Flp pilus assembly protein TadG
MTPLHRLVTRARAWAGRRWADRGDRGAAAAELALLLPVFILFYGLVTYSGRSGEAQAVTDAAARWAARTISIARQPTDAVDDARTDAADTLQVGRAACRTMTFTPTVTDTDVTVSITCTVDVSELTLLPVPGTRTIQATASEVRDRFRETSDR